MEFLKYKWSIWFTILDVNQDSFITHADVEQMIKNFPIVEGLSEEDAKLACDNIEKWWTFYILKGREILTEEELIKDFEYEYTLNKNAFIDKMKNCQEEVLKILDTDKTNSISVDNYVKGFKALGHDNEELLRKSFKLYKSANHSIPIKEFINVWLFFLTNDDPTKPDTVMDTIEAGLMECM